MIDNDQEICKWWGKIPLEKICEKFNSDPITIIKILEANGKNKCHNREVPITKFSEQIILSGIIGDGRLKVNGKLGNVYYSECHALDEKEYCEWKHKSLGFLTKTTNMYGKNLNNKYSDAIEFCTITTPSLIKYKKMSKLEVIKKLNSLGLILLILDDGWFNTHSKKGNFYLSTGELTNEEIDALVDQYNKNGFTNAHCIGKRKDISFNSCDNMKIYKYITKYIPKDTDIILKKFKFTNKDRSKGY